MMPLRQRDCWLGIGNTIRMRTKAGADWADIKARRLDMIESSPHHRMDYCDQRDIWCFAQRDAKAERAVSREIADKCVGQSVVTATVIDFCAGRTVTIAARQMIDPGGCAITFTGNGWRFIFTADKPTLNAGRPVMA